MKKVKIIKILTLFVPTIFGSFFGIVLWGLAGNLMFLIPALFLGTLSFLEIYKIIKTTDIVEITERKYFSEILIVLWLALIAFVINVGSTALSQ